TVTNTQQCQAGPDKFFFLFLCLTSLLTVTEPRHFHRLCHTSPRRRLLPPRKFTTTTTTPPCELQTPPPDTMPSRHANARPRL
ncbi:hypothetical protein EDB89DRAFT_1999019, partial [Lactarius sanguifluus]